MDIKEIKSVMIIDENLPQGIIANTAAILGITLGKRMPDIVGCDVVNASQRNHLGITGVPIPILKGDADILKRLREDLYDDEFNDLIVIDFSDVAQKCNDYNDYIINASETYEDSYTYYGICICGNKKKINKLTGSMPLLR